MGSASDGRERRPLSDWRPENVLVVDNGLAYREPFRMEGIVDPSLSRVRGDMIEALLPVVIVCVVSLLGTAVWLLATGARLGSRDSHAA
jgi:hypothetical protein